MTRQDTREAGRARQQEVVQNYEAVKRAARVGRRAVPLADPVGDAGDLELGEELGQTGPKETIRQKMREGQARQ